ncbi:MAG: transcriptional regulator [Planctomycetaceae bacterium]|nr:transcriptional regulator [Planctomycetaceae bacterium]
MISCTAEYALRAIVYLADQTGPQTNAQIAKATQVPGGYLSKVMQGLGRAGLVNGQRGLRGGFTLAREPEKLAVLEVVNVADPVRRFHKCPLDTHGIELCPLHRGLDDAAKAVEETFGDTTIADLLHVPRHRKPLCRFPAIPECSP